MDTGRKLTQTASKNPYVGPRPFQREEKDQFFGRDREGRDLVSLVASDQLVVFYAQSGTGKTSLMNTRLVPGLEERGFEVLPIGRLSGEIPDEQVDNIFATNLMTSLDMGQANPGRFKGLKLAEFLLNLNFDGHGFYYKAPAEQSKLVEPVQAPQDQGNAAEEIQIKPRVLIIDQFEELFTTHLDAWMKREDFFIQLADAMRQDPYLWVVLAMREDHIAELDRYAGLMPGGLRTRYYMQRMGFAGALQAVTLPVAKLRPFEDQAAKELVKNLSRIRLGLNERGEPRYVEGESIEPVQLQVVCYQLWEYLKTQPGSNINLADLKRLSGSGRELADFVNQALADFYKDTLLNVIRQPGVRLGENKLRDWFETRLITEARTRGLVFMGEKETAGIPNRAVQLMEGRLLRCENRAGGKWYELVHDRLVDPILRDNRRVREWHRARRLRLGAGIAGGLLVIFFMVIIFISLSTQAFAPVSSTSLAQTALADAKSTAALTVTAERLSAQSAATQAAAEMISAQSTATQVALALLPIDQLSRMITSPSPQERISAARALAIATVSNPELALQSIPLLVTRMLEMNESDPMVRQVAAEGVLQISTSLPDKAAVYIPNLINAGQDSNPLVRQLLVNILSTIAPATTQPDFYKQIQDTLTLMSQDKNPQVKKEADQAIDSLQTVGIQDFVGTWKNENPATQSWTTVLVISSGNLLSFHLFEKCYPSDCDVGIANISYQPGGLSFSLNNVYVERSFNVSLEKLTGQLIVETTNHYIDNSGSADFTERNRFNRVSLVAMIPTQPVLMPTSAPAQEGDMLYAALYWEAAGLAMIYPETNQVINTIDFPSISARYVSVNPNWEDVYVSFSNGDTFFIVDGVTGDIKGSITQEVGWNSSNSIVSDDGQEIYLATSGPTQGQQIQQRPDENRVLVIDRESLQVKKVIGLGTNKSTYGLARMVISSDSQNLYVCDRNADLLFVIDTTKLEVINWRSFPCWNLLGISSDDKAIYTLSNSQVHKVGLDSWSDLWHVDVMGYVEKVIETSDRIYIPDREGNQVIVTDIDGNIVGKMEVPDPGGIALSTDGTRLYVSSTTQNAIYEFDLINNQQSIIEITEGSGPTDLVILPVKVYGMIKPGGQRLFYN